ncbi:flagellar basal-body MS-ring/collar protein FliF [Paenibacillus larvae]
MNEKIGQYWGRVIQYWNKYSKKTKITLIAAAVFMILTVGIISYNLSKTEYSTAFTNLQPNAAADIKAYLDQEKIPYKLSADGKSIGVPTAQVAEVKIAVESKGLNKGGNVGYGIFDQSGSFGTTDNQFEMQKLNAMQGELQQLINSNQAIANSKVLINIPEQGVFLSKNEEKASASVVLEVKQGYTLDQNQIDTIYNLVSHSVKNLPLDNITIADQFGQYMVPSKADGSPQGSTQVANQFQVKKQFESDMQRNIVNLLAPMYGQNKVVVNVVSTMNFDQKKTKEQLVSAPNQDEQKGLEISVQELQKSASSDGATAGGVAGSGTNDVPGYESTSNSGNSKSEENQKTVNYEVNRITNDIIRAPYVVKDLNITVAIDTKSVNGNPGKIENAELLENAMKGIVKTALADSGVEYEQADIDKKVTIIPKELQSPSSTTASNLNNYLLYGGIGLAALALIAGTVFALRRRKKNLLEEEEEYITTGQQQVEYPTIDIENVTNDNQVRKQLETLAKKKPEEFVNLLRTWLVDE